MNKKLARQRRARKTRFKIRELGVMRLSIFKTSRHMYAQVITSDGAKILVCASTLDKELKKNLKSSGGNIEAAKAVGKLLAKRALKAGIKSVAFDRSGFQFHGRVRALAEAAREDGLVF